MNERLEPFEMIRSKGVDHEIHRDNTLVYTHLGKAAVFDHIFITLPDDSQVYLWRYSHETGEESSFFTRVKERALENECVAILNLKEASEKDIEVYIQHASADLTDIPPQFDSE